MRVTGDRVGLDTIAVLDDYSLTQHPLVCFDYRMPGPVSVDMQVQINNTWYTVGMAATGRAHRQIGSIPGVRADNRWHHVCVDVLEMARRAAPGAATYTVNAIEFGNADRSRDRKGSRWCVDNFMICDYGAPDAEFDWRAEDITGVAGYSVVFDREMETIPPQQATTKDESARFHADEPGTYWLHVAAHDSNGNWSRPRHLAYQAKAVPKPEPASAGQEAAR
jgi:hypothetical protein